MGRQDYDIYGDARDYGYGAAYDEDGSYRYAGQGFVPATRERRSEGHRIPPTGSYPAPTHQPVADDHSGRITSFLSLLLALAIVALSVAGTVIPMAMYARYGQSDLATSALAVAMGYGAIVASFLLGMPTVLIGLRSACKPRGHVGRGRGMVSVVLAVTIPFMAFVILSVFTVRRASAIDLRRAVPQVVTDSNGKAKIVGGEALGPGMSEVIDEVNEMSEQGYSVGVDADGNVVATDPSGKTVTIDEERLSELANAIPSS